MTEADLRAKVRELMASGVLPADPPPITRPAPTSTQGNRRSRVLVGGALHEPCTTIPASVPPLISYQRPIREMTATITAMTDAA